MMMFYGDKLISVGFLGRYKPVAKFLWISNGGRKGDDRAWSLEKQLFPDDTIICIS